MFALLTTTNDF